MNTNKERKIKVKLPTEISAWTVSKYLLSLDPDRKYFSRNHLLVTNKEDGYKSNPIIGNFRLNKMLQNYIITIK